MQFQQFTKSKSDILTDAVQKSKQTNALSRCSSRYNREKLNVSDVDFKDTVYREYIKREMHYVYKKVV